MSRSTKQSSRKYGLYLILVTQHPDKIDPLVVSECENFAIMRLGSEFLLESTLSSLGLIVHRAEFLNCVHSKISRTWMYGKWTDYKVLNVYAAARRTVEGGASLSDAWAKKARAS